MRGVVFDGYQQGLWDWHSEQDYQRLASWGFNVVRLPIAWDFIEPSPGKYDDSYFSKYVDRDIAWAKKYGLYIVLDMQQWGWSSRFTYYSSWGTCGVPRWAVANYPNNATGEAQSKADFYNNLGPNGTPNSSTNPSMQDRFTQMWKYVAGKYARETTIAAYDVLNEPTVFSSDHKSVIYDPSEFYSETEIQFLTKVIDAIRAVDANHMIVWEKVMETNVPPRAIDRPNLVYSPHYPGCTGEHLSFDNYDGNKAWLQNWLESHEISFSRQWNQPVYVGEWGILVEGIGVAQYIRDFLDLMDQYQMSATWYGYGRANWGMYLMDGSGNLRTTLVENLVRPYVGVSSVTFSASFNTDDKRMQIAVKGPSTLTIYLPASYATFTLTTDSGTASWAVDRSVLILSLSDLVSQMALQFG